MATTPPADDPPDDDLIAYLDGELDDDAAEAVESQLANDPAARARADEHKKAYDLLDYLPKSEPSPTFTTRTITRLMPTAAVSGSQPTPTVPPAPRRRVWPEVLAWGLLAVLAGAVVYASVSFTRPTPPPPAPLGLDDLPVIESLPLYAGVDDVAFLRELHKTDLFDADSADADPPRRDTLPAADRERLIEQFRTFTPARQQQLRTLHQKLNDPTANDRGPLLRTLETYAVWLARLPDADRKKVYDAAPEQRLEVVQQVSEKRWREQFTQRQQELLKHVESTEEKQEWLQSFRTEEKSRREEWEIADRVWRLTTAGKVQGKDYKPWPFDQPGAERQVDEYIRNAFGLDPKGVKLKKDKDKDKADPLPATCRLTPQEAAELIECHEAVGRGERWFNYVVMLQRLSEKYPTLPRPKDGKPVTGPKDLQGTGYAVPKEDVLKRRAIVGKWPDFALEVWQPNKDAKLPPLGPCKPDEFTPAVKEFVTGKLWEKLTPAEKDRLKGLEGKWPEYPREVMKLAGQKNESVPEVTLPGEPDNWRKYYQLAPAKK